MKRLKFAGVFYVERAKKLDELHKAGVTKLELANRFNLSQHTVDIILHDWRKREVKP